MGLNNFYCNITEKVEFKVQVNVRKLNKNVHSEEKSLSQTRALSLHLPLSCIVFFVFRYMKL